MRYRIIVCAPMGDEIRSVNVDREQNAFTSFPAESDNPAYNSFLESQALTDAEVQAMEPDVWHDMA